MFVRNFCAGVLMLSAALGALPALGAGAGDHHHGSAAGSPGDPRKVTRTVEVVMDDNMRFTPARVEVRPGETIRFRVANAGQVKHEMVLGTAKELNEHAALMRKFPEMEHDDPNSVTVEPGQTGELIWRFTRAGTFGFACLLPGHFEAGMKGTLVVRRAQAARPASAPQTTR